MPKTIPEKNKHRIERVIDALVERFARDVENLVQAHTVHGRPLFGIELTPDEQQERWLDPVTRAATLARMTDEKQILAAYRRFAPEDEKEPK